MTIYDGENWSKGNTLPLRVCVQMCTATVDISLLLSQKIENQSTSWHNDTILGHILQGIMP